MTVLSEPGVLRLIVGSNLPATQRFEAWVFEGVVLSARPMAVDAWKALRLREVRVAVVRLKCDHRFNLGRTRVAPAEG